MNGAVITALNEAETIGGLVAALRGLNLSVCVVDDGSTDGTGVIAMGAGAHVIRHERPQNIGVSLVEAWRYALRQGWDRTLQIDAGGSHDPNEYFLFTSLPHDVIIGSRFREGSNYIGKGWRKAGSRLAAWLCNFATHKKITDWTSGYRSFSKAALEKLARVRYLANGHAWQMEVLHAALKTGLTIDEAPITYKAGASSFKWKTIDEAIKVYLWILHA